MHLLGIAIHEIVEENGKPSHARGSAAFSYGSIIEFSANLQYPDKYAIALDPPPVVGGEHRAADHSADLIYDELGLTEIYKRQQAYLKSRKRKPEAKELFTRERIAACREFMTDDQRALITYYRNQLPDRTS